MLDLKSKYSMNMQTSQETYTVKSVLEPNLSQLNIQKASIFWYRQPPASYEIQELSFNFNKKTYRCSSLDYDCSIICKVIQQNGKEVARFDYGPIQTFMFNRLSANLQLRVQVVLFNNTKKCLFSFNSTPTLINPQNNNKYQLTHQDIRSVYLKSQDLQHQFNTSQDQVSYSINKKKKTIVVENLFQRLILLKLFHQIPNGMYCYSMEILQISFYDQTSCNIALLALNRFKYQKKQTAETSKSMFNHTLENLSKSKLMKKSNQQISNYLNQPNSQFPFFSGHSNNDQIKKQSLQTLGYNLKRLPKQSMKSGTSSMMSGKSSNATQSKKSLMGPRLQNQKGQIMQNQLSQQYGQNSELKSRISIKQPKFSILSTQITSIKGNRQQKSSFPQTPVTSNLKSSELLKKPNQFRSPINLRRSQDEIKTPRLDEDQQKCEKKEQFKDKINVSQNEHGESQEENGYVDEFENLLFEGEKQKGDGEEMCLNDSFTRMEEEEKKEEERKERERGDLKKQRQAKQRQKPQRTPYNQAGQGIKRLTRPQQKQREKQEWQTQNMPSDESSLKNGGNSQCQRQGSSGKFQSMKEPLSPTKSEKSIIELKEKFELILQENSELKIKNQLLKKQIEQAKSSNIKKNQLLQYQQQIAQMKTMQINLIQSIQALKKPFSNSSPSSQLQSNRPLLSVYQHISPPSYNIQPIKHYRENQTCTLNQKQNNQTSSKDQKADFQFYQRKKIEPRSPSGLISPPRQSKNTNDLNFNNQESISPIFAGRRSEDYDKNNNVQTQYSNPSYNFKINNGQIASNTTNLFNSGQLGQIRFMKFQSDPDYQKYRNNQSYSYKTNFNARN